MKMIDAQIHVWLPNTPDRPWPPGARSLHGDPFTAEDALAALDAAGVTGAVLNPPSWTGSNNSYALEAAAKHPDRFAVVGRYDHEAPDAREQLEGWRDTPGMVGIRVTLHVPAMRPLFIDPAFHWFWAGVEAADLPVWVYTPANLHVLAPIAERHPRLRLIVDHAGRNARGPKDAAAWEDLPALLELARFPRLAVKVSSLPAFSTAPYPFPVLHTPIRAIRDAFGADRLMWGSDLTRLGWPYGDNVRLFAEGLDFLSDTEREWIFGRSIEKWCDVRL